MVINMTSRGNGPALIARELALDFHRLSWHPRAVQHIPGEINDVSDYLSRLQDPSCDKPLPPALRKVTIESPPHRTPSFYHTLTGMATLAKGAS
eukprot:5228220-Amphidinium_carterae.1